LGENDKVYDLLEEAEKATKRAGNLSKQLITFTKGGEPIKKPQDLEKLVRETAAFTLTGSNIKIRWNIKKSGKSKW
jgi:hypothetical protein